MTYIVVAIILLLIAGSAVVGFTCALSAQVSREEEARNGD